MKSDVRTKTTAFIVYAIIVGWSFGRIIMI